MNPFSVPNRPSMIGWKRYTGHLLKILHLMHLRLRETQCTLQHTLTQTCSTIWLWGGLKLVCYISSTRPLLTPSRNDRTKWNQQPMVRNSWLLARQSYRSSIYDAHFICLVCLLRDHLGCSVTIKPSSQALQSHIRLSTNVGMQSLIIKYVRPSLVALFASSIFPPTKTLQTY